MNSVTLSIWWLLLLVVVGLVIGRGAIIKIASGLALLVGIGAAAAWGPSVIPVINTVTDFFG